MSISIIVAMSEDRVIGREGDLPWHISEDLKRFKRTTMDHAIIMGRKTYDSIGRPLPGRRSIVITRNKAYKPKGVEVVSSLEAALELTIEDDEVFIVGGEQIYQQALPLADMLYLTRVQGEVEGDRYFPDVQWRDWQLVERTIDQVDEESGLTYHFAKFVRARVLDEEDLLDDEQNDEVDDDDSDEERAIDTSAKPR